MEHIVFRSADDLRWDMKGPCADCPFRRNAPDHEGVASSIVGYVEAMERHGFSHTCHKTDNLADGPRNHTGPLQHCGGALHFMVRAKCDLQSPLLKAADAGKLDIKAMVKRARRDRRVFGSVMELVEYYLAMAKRIMAAKKRDPEVCVIDPADYGARPLMVPISRAKADGMEIVECSKCGEPAVTHDPYWPYCMSANYCAKCSGGVDRTIEELEAMAKGGA